MKKMLKIFYIAPEVAPFVKTCKIADITGAFPKALKELGHDIRVMMPNYKCINARKYVLRDVIRLKDMIVSFGGGEVHVSAKSAFLPNSKVQIYFLDNREYFGRNGIYSDPQKEAAYNDNDERFILFCKGCVETLRMLHWQPDIIHCNDWQCGFLPVYVKKMLSQDPFFKNTKVALSIFDLKRDAHVQKETIEKAGISPDIFGANEIDADGGIDLLKSAVLHSDIVFVDNENKISSHAFPDCISQNVRDILLENADKLVELGSGIDNSVWDPSTDQYLQSTYDIDCVSKKEENKKSLLAELELEYNARTPLIYMSALPEKSKDFNKILNSIPDILELGAHFILLSKNSDGDSEKFARLNKKYPKKFLFKKQYDIGFAHALMASADFYLAPAWEEPIISNHLIGLKYGTIPVVTAEEGFIDTIKDYSKSSKNATGFVFNGSDDDGIINTLKTALELYQNIDKWENLIKNAMKQDYSWHSVGPKYIERLSRFF